MKSPTHTHTHHRLIVSQTQNAFFRIKEETKKKRDLQKPVQRVGKGNNTFPTLYFARLLIFRCIAYVTSRFFSLWLKNRFFHHNSYTLTKGHYTFFLFARAEGGLNKNPTAERKRTPSCYVRSHPPTREKTSKVGNAKMDFRKKSHLSLSTTQATSMSLIFDAREVRIINLNVFQSG